MFDINENLKKLPDTPGVYIHKDKGGRIIYEGKAASLKNRVRQYFGSLKNMEPKSRAMVAKIASFEYIETTTEMEALILECNLIKKYMPKYNILLRDDKTYPYIKMTLGEEYPRLLKTRLVKNDGSRYFGPYANTNAVNQMVDLLNGIYGLKRCSTTFDLAQKVYKPCLNYHIKQCQGICTGKVTHEVYKEGVAAVMDFLSDRKKPLTAQLKKKMKAASENQAYEEAAYYRDLMAAAEAILELATSPIAKSVRLDAEKKAKDESLEEKKKARQDKDEYLSRRLHEITNPEEPYQHQQLRIEAYDVSTGNGVDTVGAMVVFLGGKSSKKSYRRFKVRTVGVDDYGSLQEILLRRLKRGIDGDPGFIPLPDIILMDGGKGHVSAAEKVMKALNLDLAVLGMVKDDKHRTRALVWGKDEIDLKKEKDLYNAIGSIQEEVHRFAIEYHRKRQEKGINHSALDGIEGIGPAKRNSLLQHFKGLDEIKGARPEELMEVRGISQNLALKIYEYFN